MMSKGLENFVSEFPYGGTSTELMEHYRSLLKERLGFIAVSLKMRDLEKRISEVARERFPVTIVGKRGVGRETVARAIHLEGPSWWRRCFTVDLTGYSEAEAKRLLVGYREGGLFKETRIEQGIFQLAARSTLCFSNFDSYPRSVQMLIFAAWESGKFIRGDTNSEEKFTARLIFLVQRPPNELVRHGEIDEKVVPMLSAYEMHVPPLSERREDILPLAEKFLTEASNILGLRRKILSREAERWLKKAPWTQNIPQLKKVIYLAYLTASDEELKPHHFALLHDDNIVGYEKAQLEEIGLAEVVEKKLEIFLERLKGLDTLGLYDVIISKVEEPLIRLVMNYTGGNQIRASRLLGINRNTLRAKIRKYDLKIKRGRGR